VRPRPAELRQRCVWIVQVRLELGGGDRSISAHDEEAVGERDRCPRPEVAQRPLVRPFAQLAVVVQQRNPGIDVGRLQRAQPIAWRYGELWQALERVAHMELRQSPDAAPTEELAQDNSSAAHGPVS
jgi:hypothetical protein